MTKPLDPVNGGYIDDVNTQQILTILSNWTNQQLAMEVFALIQKDFRKKRK